jgi:hypothetical protein
MYKTYMKLIYNIYEQQDQLKDNSAEMMSKDYKQVIYRRNTNGQWTYKIFLSPSINTEIKIKAIMKFHFML